VPNIKVGGMSYRVPTFIVAAALVAGGCGSDNNSSSNKPASSGSTAASTSNAAKAPYGLYVRTVTKQDIARTAAHRDEHGPNQSTPTTGKYRLVIAKGASQDVIKLTGPDGFTIDMDMNVVPGSLKLTSYVDPSRAAFCGPEIPAQATYSFKTAASSLQLQPNDDPCADRDSTLTGTWSKG
jgi:hypothetical protein